MPLDLSAPAELVESIHRPHAATVSDCLHRWWRMDADRRAQSYLVVHGAAGRRRTFNSRSIAELAAVLAD